MGCTPRRLRTLAFAASVLAWGETLNAQGPPATPATQPDLSQENRETPPVEKVVVTASRREEELINAPATMTVITKEAIRTAPSQRVTDLLRLVPGINTVQTAARDVNITSRTSTGTLTNSLLVLLDGRSVYQDFFGIVLWDLLPIDPEEIEQIEVIRGPASAVWGPNALTGVVNVITRRPRDMVGTTVSARFGLVDTAPAGADFDRGGIFALNALHAAAPSDRFAFKISAGLAAQEAFARPTGTLPNGAPYEPFENTGTTQPKLDARADYDFADGDQRIVLAGGIAGTDGTIHTGLGPLDIRSGSTLKYGRLLYTRKKLKLQAFVNALDAEAPFLLKTDAAGGPLHHTYENQVYDVEFSNEHVLGDSHLLSYGGNYRRNNFDLSLAPLGDNRDEGGAYLQDVIFLTDRLRWMVGARMDLFDTLDKAVFSPRTALIFNVRPAHTMRVSFNRSFRSPSFVNNFFDIEFFNQIALPTGPYRFPSRGLGNQDLDEESLTAYEAGYIGMAGPLTLGAAVYLNRARNLIQFTQIESYNSSNPPPQWPLPPSELDALGLPSKYQYRNFDRITERGVELSLEARVAAGVNTFANYTWQDDPHVEGFDPAEANRPPTYRFNAGVSVEQRRYFASVTAAFEDGAFWQDVLNTPFHGKTTPYSIVNAAIGLKSADNSIMVAVRGRNAFNRPNQQHVYGDVIKGEMIGEVRLTF